MQMWSSYFNFNKFKNILQWRVTRMAAHGTLTKEKKERRNHATWSSESEKGIEETRNIPKWWFLVNSLINDDFNSHTYAHVKSIYISFYDYYLWLMTILICGIEFRSSLSLSLSRTVSLFYAKSHSRTVFVCLPFYCFISTLVVIFASFSFFYVHFDFIKQKTTFIQ